MNDKEYGAFETIIAICEARELLTQDHDRDISTIRTIAVRAIAESLSL